MAEREPCPTVVTPSVEPRARVPERTCVGCRVRAPATGLLRMVVQGSSVVPDPRRRLPGRGASVHPTEECIDLAEQRRAFVRALRAPGRLDVSAVRAHVARAAGPDQLHQLHARDTQRRQVENP